MSTTGEVRRAISRVANMVLNDDMSPQRANSILCACNSILAAVRVDDQARKLEELERLMMERKEK